MPEIKEICKLFFILENKFFIQKYVILLYMGY